MLTAACVLALALPGSGCEGHKFEPPSRAAQVQQAEQLYSDEIFDTLTWQSDAQRLEFGNTVFASYCRKCHGYLGRGNTDYDRVHGLGVPSLVRPDFPLAGDLAAVRRRIFVGHQEMPTWGIAGITPREVDAVAYYILDELRPDVLRGGPQTTPDTASGTEPAPGDTGAAAAPADGAPARSETGAADPPPESPAEVGSEAGAGASGESPGPPGSS